MFRPAPSHFGSYSLGALVLTCGDDGVGADAFAAAVMAQHARLTNDLQDLLRPGPPVSLVLNFILPVGVRATLVPSVTSWPIDRAVRRDDMIARIFARLTPFVAGAFQNVRQQLADQAMQSDANAPAISTVQ